MKTYAPRQITITGSAAIEYVEYMGLDCGLRAYAADGSPELFNLTPLEARAMDITKIHFVADTEHPDHDAAMASLKLA